MIRRSILIFTFLSGVWGGRSLAAPCSEKVLAFSDPTIGVTAIEDCEDANVVYIVPQELVVSQGSFSGTKMFRWQETEEGARLLMRMKLNVDENRLMRAMKDLRRNYQRPFKFLPFQLKNVELTGFDSNDGVVAQAVSGSSQDSNGYFTLRVELNHEGVELWKESADWDDWILEPAHLSYQMKKIDADGIEVWQPQSHAVFFESLPSCVILKNCQEDDSKRRLLDRGRSFGGHYFHSQFLQCADFIDKSIYEPSVLEIVDRYLTPDEKEIVALAAKDGFKLEKTQVESNCSKEIDLEKGRRWFDSYSFDSHLTCSNKFTWQFKNVKEKISAASEGFVAGARESWQELWDQCGGGFGEIRCDERQGDNWCTATLQGSDTMCFSSGAMRENIPFTDGSCTVSVFERFILNGFSFKALQSFSTLEVKQDNQCLSFQGSSTDRNDYRVQVVCKEEDQ